MTTYKPEGLYIIIIYIDNELYYTFYINKCIIISKKIQPLIFFKRLNLSLKIIKPYCSDLTDFLRVRLFFTGTSTTSSFGDTSSNICLKGHFTTNHDSDAQCKANHSI